MTQGDRTFIENHNSSGITVIMFIILILRTLKCAVGELSCIYPSVLVGLKQ